MLAIEPTSPQYVSRLIFHVSSRPMSTVPGLAAVSVPLTRLLACLQQAMEDDAQLHGCVAALASFLEEHDLRSGTLDGEPQLRLNRGRITTPFR